MLELTVSKSELASPIVTPVLVMFTLAAVMYTFDPVIATLEEVFKLAPVMSTLAAMFAFVAVLDTTTFESMLNSPFSTYVFAAVIVTNAASTSTLLLMSFNVALDCSKDAELFTMTSSAPMCKSSTASVMLMFAVNTVLASTFSSAPLM